MYELNQFTKILQALWVSVSFSFSFLQRKRLHCLYVRGEPAYPDSTPWWPSSHVTLPPALDEQCGAGRFQTSCAATRGLWKWWRRWGVTRARGHDGQQPTLAARRRLGLPEGDNHGAQQSHVHDCQGEAPSAFPQILIHMSKTVRTVDYKYCYENSGHFYYLLFIYCCTLEYLYLPKFLL